MSRNYLLDTNAIIRHFCSMPSLGREASSIIKRAESGNGDVLIISIISLAEKIIFHELHDRLILATAKYYDAVVLSSDKLFLKVKGTKVIW